MTKAFALIENYNFVSFSICQAIKHLDMRFSIMLIAISSSSITMFIFCYFGKMATDAYFSYGDYAYEAKWYTIPVKNQNYFRLIILIAQQPLCYEGLGIILNLQTFSAVRNAF